LSRNGDIQGQSGWTTVKHMTSLDSQKIDLVRATRSPQWLRDMMPTTATDDQRWSLSTN
jgi:hypothetical protein